MEYLRRIGLYRTDGRNGLEYDLPAMVVCERSTHPGDYPDGSKNPLPVPEPDHVHIVVFTPGGMFTQVVVPDESGDSDYRVADPKVSSDFVGAETISPGTGTYVELNVPVITARDEVKPRTWRLQ